MRAYLTIALLLAGAAAVLAVATSTQAQIRIALEPVFQQLRFDRPVVLTHAGDETDRIFIAEQGGTIRVFPNTNDARFASTFLDLSARVDTELPDAGLLGLAFDPGYAVNRHFYVFYIAGAPPRAVIARYAVSANDPGAASPQSELVLLEEPLPSVGNYGGTLAFGADGYLYASIGDGGASRSAQDPNTLLGSVLRIDVRNAAPGSPYAIPGDNPLISNIGARDEIWAYGFRNPRTFSFDPESGELWVADIGQSRFEEVGVVVAGANYGWPVMEGSSCFNAASCNREGLRTSLLQYSRSDERCGATGGYVYYGRLARSLDGHYLYADSCSGEVWAAHRVANRMLGPIEVLTSEVGIRSFGTDERGELYAIGVNAHLYRFVGSGDALLLPDPSMPTPTPVPPRPTSTPAVEHLRLPFEGAPELGLLILGVVGSGALILILLERVRRR